MNDVAAPSARAVDVWGVAISQAIVGLVCIRCVASQEPMPWWALDPMVTFSPPTGITPMWSVAMDLLTLAFASIVMLRGAMHGRAVPAGWLLAALIGVGFAAWHGRPLPDRSWLEHARVGLGWTSAVIGGFALWHAAHDAAVRRVTVGMLLGIVAMLVAKGAVQVFVEHPQTVADYRLNKASFLAANGWLDGSDQVRAFERRLMQPEATGWFGLSNVFASLCAAGAVTMAGLAYEAWRSRRDQGSPSSGRWLVVALGFGAVVAVVGVVLSGSRAGLGLVVIGLVGLGLVGAVRSQAALRERMTSRIGWIAIGVIAMVPVLIMLHGQMGERAPDRSLLFRWFYMQGASRIIADHPLAGVGPASFKDAYLLAKPPLSPESIESPHSAAFDWLACMGIGGLAWVVMLVAAVYVCGHNLLAEAAPGTDEHQRAEAKSAASGLDRRMLVVGVCAVFVISTLIESAILTPEAAIMRVVGMAGWLALGWGVIVLLAQRPEAIWPIGIGALVLVAHAQIEMTLTRPGSAHWAMALIATAAQPTATRLSSNRRWGLVLAAIPAILAMWGAVGWGWRIAIWERHLANAAFGVMPTALGTAPSKKAMEVALVDLALAESAIGFHQTTMESHTRMSLLFAQAELADPRGNSTFAENAVDRALHRTGKFVEANPGSATAWGWRSVVQIQSARLVGERAPIETVKETLERAATLDPHGLTFPLRLVDWCESAGDSAGARYWAKRALAINQSLRLDPLMQLSDARQAKLQALVEGAR